MKKLLLFIPLIFLITSCQQNKENNNAFNITTSFYPIYIFTENITEGAENITVSNLASPQSGCLHDYQLSAKDMKTLSKSEMLIINGAGMENFINKAVSLYPDIVISDSSKNIPLVENSDTHDHNHTEEEETEFNSHIWLSIERAKIQIKNIADDLSNINSENSNIYLNNAQKFIDELSEKTEAISKQILDITTKKPLKVISFHEGFDYIANDYNIKIIKSIIFDENKQPSAKEIAEIINTINSEKITAIFTADGAGLNLANTISSETDAKVYKINPITSGNMSKQDYINIMSENLKTILEASKENE